MTTTLTIGADGTAAPEVDPTASATDPASEPDETYAAGNGDGTPYMRGEIADRLMSTARWLQ